MVKAGFWVLRGTHPSEMLLLTYRGLNQETAQDAHLSVEV
jgi:hypothetical protein